MNSIIDFDLLQQNHNKKLPTLFLGHGSPMNAIEENEFANAFKELAKTFAKPKAILCISSHWFIPATKVTAMQKPRTIHDFGNFPQELFDVEYPAQGMPDLAEYIQELLFPHKVELDYDWGFDHGAGVC